MAERWRSSSAMPSWLFSASPCSTKTMPSALAAPGEILLGESTFHLVHGAVDVEEVGPLELKGKAKPVHAHGLLAVRDAPSRRHEGRFVARDAELEALRQTWRRIVDEERCERVTVPGDT